MPFVVFEGLDGSGKSTLIKGLADQLKSQGKTVVLTREPGGTPLGEEIRKLLLEDGPRAPVPRAELLLYQAGRAQHVDQVIAPALEKGQWVICDRFTASSLAFQCGGRGLDEQEVRNLNQYAINGVTPDLTVLLKVSVDTAEKRRSQRAHVDRFEQEKSEFHQRVYEHYLSQVKTEPQKWLVVDGEAATPKILLEQLLADLKKRGWV
ncbi:MAG: dTMP kinase [Bdellovibrionales bacterium]